MATAFGHNGWIGWANESTYGTYVAATSFCEILSENFKGEQKRIGRPTLRQVSVANSVAGKKSVGGGFSAQFHINGMEKILYNALGTVNTSGSGPYTHAYTGATTLPTGMSFHVNRDAANVGTGSAFKYFGCMVSKLTFKQQMDDYLGVDVEVAGQDWGNLNVETPSFPTFSGVDYASLGTFTIGGSAYTVRDLEITIENELATDRDRLGSRLIRGLGRSGPRKVTGKFTKEFESLTEYAVFRDLSNAALVATWTTGSHSLSISLPKIYVQGDDPETGDAGPIVMTFNFEAFQNSAAGDECAITLINSTSSGS